MGKPVVKERRKPDPRVGRLQTGLTELTEQVTANTVLTQQTAELAQKTADLAQKTASNTDEIVEFWRNAKGGLEVLAFLGRIARPVGYIALAIGALSTAWYSLTHFGQKPEITP